MNSWIDYILLFLLIMVISIIIGLNIVGIVDNKIKNISVNLPPIKIPDPTIIMVDGKCKLNIKKLYENNKKLNNTKIIETKDLKNLVQDTVNHFRQ